MGLEVVLLVSLVPQQVRLRVLMDLLAMQLTQTTHPLIALGMSVATVMEYQVTGTLVVVPAPLQFTKAD